MTPAQIKAVRNGMNWNLTEASKRTGYSRQHIHDVEKSRYIVTQELINAFTAAIEKSVAAHQKILQKMKNNA